MLQGAVDMSGAGGDSGDAFDLAKRRVTSKVDLSRKGSVDEPVRDLLETLNQHPDFFSLSSCSGRIVLLREGTSDGKKVRKEGCQWILVSHEPVESGTLWKKLLEEEEERGGNVGGTIVLKFEPFILHVQCRTLEVAKELHTQSLECGFKNSGLTVGKNGKLVLAVRSAHGLEVPLTDAEGRLLVSREYVNFVASSANEKLAVNEERHRRFHQRLRSISQGRR